MVRTKFLLFALLVLGLGVMHLPLVSGPLSLRALEGTAAPTQAAAAEISRALEARRLAVQGLALSLAASPEVASAVQPQVEALPKDKGIRIVEPPVAERFGALSTAAQPLVPEPMKGSLVLALVTSEGTLYSRAGGEPLADDALDVRALRDVGSTGRVVDVFDAPHVFYSVPVLWNAEGGHSQVAATLVVGAPLLDTRVVEMAASSAGVSALVLLSGEKAGEKKVLVTTGPEKALVNDALKVLPEGKNGFGVVKSGAVRGFLPQLPQLQLPILTRADDYQGGAAPLAMGSRRVLADGFEVVGVTSVRPFMEQLAEYQASALIGLLGLAGFSLVWTLVMGVGLAPKDKKKETEQKAQAPSAPAAGPVLSLRTGAHAPLTMTPVQEPPVPTADDFNFSTTATPAPSLPPPVAEALPAAPSEEAYPFPAAPPVAEAFDSVPPPVADAYPFPAAPAPVVDPFASPTVPGKDPFAGRASMGDAFPFASGGNPGVASSAKGANFDFDDHPTAAYSLQQAANPFAAAAAQAGLPSSSFGAEPSPEPTLVAAIPRELLERAARPTTAEYPLPLSLGAGHPGVAGALAPTPAMGTPMMGMAGLHHPASGAGAIALTEEQHFQDVFREFVVTRDQCGEPNDGLTYDKFVAKLRKNKEQLVQKYACKTVRFQVYVKEGKAALKATPVKE